MSEKKSNVISLCEYRKKREAESRPFFRAGIKPVPGDYTFVPPWLFERMHAEAARLEAEYMEAKLQSTQLSHTLSNKFEGLTSFRPSDGLPFEFAKYDNE